MSEEEDFKIETLSLCDLDPAFDDAVRQEVVKTVYSIWFSEKRVMKRGEIMEKTIEKIKNQVKDGLWKNTWKVPNERTVGRRIDEACTPTPYTDLVPRLEEISKGKYRPNMERFEE
jgi:hypothetical protein